MPACRVPEDPRLQLLTPNAHPGGAAVMAQVLRFLPPMWGTWIGFLTPALAQGIVVFKE